MPFFFIDRPVFAGVIALLISIFGLIALPSLPIEQYPSVAPPMLNISFNYPGADAETLEQSVTQVIEQELTGVDHLLYMASASQADGSGTIDVTFKSGTDINVALMEVQNRMKVAEPRLPDDVRRQGIPVTKTNANWVMLIGVRSKSGATDVSELANFADARVVDELRRVDGVGEAELYAAPHAMRIWLNPDRLASFHLSPAEALAAVREQNSQNPGGQLGDLPLARDIELNATVITEGRLKTPEQFREIILRANPDSSTVTLGDVARVEMGSLSYGSADTLNGRPAALMSVLLATGGNAVEVAEGVRHRLHELESGIPDDIELVVAYDVTNYITTSIKEVVRTLVEAMVLVFLVMLLFLQNWRATLIPALVVPIALLGACGVLAIMGYSINVLTLFAMVLSIGILVDDAIVVIENVERLMTEEGLSPRDATVKGMQQITSAIVGITMVLLAVFVPMSFFPGSTGGIYRQFAVTLIGSIGISAFLALSLTPALCATFLRPNPPENGTANAGPVARFFAVFERWFDRTRVRYQRGVGGILARPKRWLAVFALLLGVTAMLFHQMPTGFMPTEDSGEIMTIIQAPPGATRPRINEAISHVEKYYGTRDEVEHLMVIRGFSFFGRGQANAMAFAELRPWNERKGKGSDALSIADDSNTYFHEIGQATVFSAISPPMPELGMTSGFNFRLKDLAGHGEAALLDARNQLLGAAMQSPALTNVRPEGQEYAPQLKVTVDRVKARALGLSIGDVNDTLAITFGSAYANDFTHDGRILRVMLQADAPYRMTPADILALRVRNAAGDMVQFNSFTHVEWTIGPQQLQRYNGYSSMSISGDPAAGHSSGDAMAEMTRLARDLPQGFGYEWTGTSFEEQQASGQVGTLLGLSFLIVFLVLAALYESWTVPIAVMLVVPLGVLGAVVMTMARGLPADIYFNVGLVAIIGLAAKNAVLIVEFAIEAEANGKSPLQATLEAVRMRLRPIIMTSLAFIGGMIPLFVASGAGAASRIAVGTGVIGGMLTATLLGIFFTPLFYLSIRRWINRNRPVHEGHEAQP